jgi:DNA-binding MarR family transcriptional regulator
MHETRESLGYQVKALQHTIRVKMDHILSEINLTAAQYATLQVLKENSGISGAALARKCFVTPQTINEILNNLVDLGYIKRQSHPEHGRIIQTYITPIGEEMLNQAENKMQLIDDQLEEGLSSKEKDWLISWLKEKHIRLKG